MEIEKKYYILSELFSSFERGKVHSQNSLPEGNSHFYVGAKKKRNGVMCRCGYDNELISKGNCIIFICNGEGSVGYSLYMDRDFMASGDLVLAYGNFLNPYIGLYLVTLLDLERPKYSFGRKYGSHVKTTRVLLPTKNNEPDWQYMENFVKDQIIPQLPKKAQKVWLKKYDPAPMRTTKMQLNTQDWEWFLLKDLFNLKRGKRLTEYDREKGDIPFVTAGVGNNGVSEYISNDVELYNNAITIDMFGCAFYREYTFACDDNILVLTHEKLNSSNGLFIASIIDRDKYKFAYGRQYRQKSFNKQKIKLPVTPEGTPDWQFMENYIKSLPYSKNIEPSDPNEVVDELVEMKKEMIKMRHQLQAAQTAQEVKIIGGNVTFNDYSTNYNVKK